MKRKASAEEKNTLKKSDIPKPSFVVIRSYTNAGYKSGDNSRQFLTRSRVLVYSDSDEADNAIEEFFETGKLRKKQKRRRQKKPQPPPTDEENYDKILYYSDDDADVEACELLDSSNKSFPPVKKLFKVNFY